MNFRPQNRSCRPNFLTSLIMSRCHYFFYKAILFVSFVFKYDIMQHLQRLVFVAYVKVVHVPIDKLYVVFPTWAVLLRGSSPNIKNYPWREWDKCVGATIFLRSNLSSSLLNYWIQVSIVQFKQESCELSAWL